MAGVQEAVVWHDVECGGFEADLALWEELARGTGPVLELGCGNGRVALALARHGHEVWGLDTDPALLAELGRRADAEGLDVHRVEGDAASFAIDPRFGLVIAPMQLVQLLPGSVARVGCLGAIAAHLTPGGAAALAIVEEVEAGVPPSPLLPDVRERDGWVYSSLPLGATREEDSLLVERLRQVVDPAGHLSEARDTVRLQLVSAGQLEVEARAAGLEPAGRRRVEPTDDHIGSTVVRLEAS